VPSCLVLFVFLNLPAFGGSAWDLAPFALGFAALFEANCPIAARRLKV
jgi:hypothetical protein